MEEIPGGKIEPNETPLDAARRELYEENSAKKFDIIPMYLFDFPTCVALFCLYY